MREFFGVLAQDFRGSMGKTLHKKVYGKRIITSKPKHVLAQGVAPEFWREVYTATERLWLTLNHAQRDDWLHNSGYRGGSGRDYFGHVNMRQVGIYQQWLPVKPPICRQGLVADMLAGGVPIPAYLRGCLPTSWVATYGGLTTPNSEERIAVAPGLTPSAAVDAAYALIPGIPWTNSIDTRAQHTAQVGWWAGSYQATVTQRRVTKIFAATTHYPVRRCVYRDRFAVPGLGTTTGEVAINMGVYKASEQILDIQLPYNQRLDRPVGFVIMGADNWLRLDWSPGIWLNVGWRQAYPTIRYEYPIWP